MVETNVPNMRAGLLHAANHALADPVKFRSVLRGVVNLSTLKLWVTYILGALFHHQSLNNGFSVF